MNATMTPSTDAPRRQAPMILAGEAPAAPAETSTTPAIGFTPQAATLNSAPAAVNGTGNKETWTLKGSFTVGRPFANKWENAFRQSAWNLDLELRLDVLGKTWTTKTFGYFLR